MPHIHQAKYHSHLHKVKRLHHSHRHGERLMLNKLPGNILDEELLNRTPKYSKFFDYPLPQLLADHSTNPFQNTTRQYVDSSLNITTKGRFVNHEMIIRRNGETTILRPRQDLVLANGFTPVIRPSSQLPVYHSQVTSFSTPSLSIMNKMSMKKCEQTSVIKYKQKDRHHRKRCNEIFNKQNNLKDYHFSNDFEHNHLQTSNFIHLVTQALHEMIEEQTPQPVPLMSILPQFHSPYNQSFPPRLEEPHYNRTTIPSPYLNERSFNLSFQTMSTNRYPESFYNAPPPPPPEQYHQSYFNCPPPEHFHSPISRQRNSTPMSDYFFDYH